MEWNGGNVQWEQAPPMTFQSNAAVNDFASNYIHYGHVASSAVTSAAVPTQTFQTVEMQTFQQMVPEIEYVPVPLQSPQVEFVPVQRPPQIEYVHMQNPMQQSVPPSPPLLKQPKAIEGPERAQYTYERERERAAPQYTHERERERTAPPEERVVDVPVEKVKIMTKEVQVEKLVVKEELVPVEKIVERTVQKQFETPKEVIVQVPVERLVYRDIEIPVEKIVENKIWRTVEVPVEFLGGKEKERAMAAETEEVQVHRVRIQEVEIPITMQRTVEKRVDQIIENFIEKPVERVIEKLIPIEVPVDRIVEKIVYREPETYYSPPKYAPRNVGVGLSLERLEGTEGTYVERIVPGFAAEGTGLFQVGDIVLGINGIDVEGMSLEAIKRLTVGPERTMVTLEMQRISGQRYVADLERRIPVFTNDSNIEATQVLVDRVCKSLAEMRAHSSGQAFHGLARNIARRNSMVLHVDSSSGSD